MQESPASTGNQVVFALQPLTFTVVPQHHARMPTRSNATHEQQVLRLARKRTLLRARDLTEHGLPTVTLTRLVQAGKLERAGRGLYSLPDAPISEHRSLAEVSARVPKGIVCLLSALEVHEIGTQAPF